MSELEAQLFTPQRVKDDFPLLQQTVHEKPLVYLDSGATSQKPQQVIDAVNQYYTLDNANVHRGIYDLSQRATAAFEAARQGVRNFIHAKHNHEIIFTRGTTEAINLVAHSFGDMFVNAGDEIIISAMEHHSNIVPWQMLCERKGAHLKIIQVTDEGCLDMTHFQSLINSRTKLVSVIHASNVLGTINPVEEIVAAAKAHDIPVLLDGAQAVSHLPVDVCALDCDFYVFSAHKLYGPTGTGVLYGKEKWLNAMPPYQGGGDMIRRVTFEKTEYNVPPYKFEAGTPNMAGVIGLGAAIDYVNRLGLDNIAQHESALLSYATSELEKISGLRIIGTATEKVGVISFTMDCAHPHDIATILDSEGIAIRAGHHCAMPLIERFGVPATARISLAVYNQKQDIDRLVIALNKVKNLFE